MHSDQLTIGEVAKAAGVRTSKIRYYESVGLLESVPRVSGHRVYTRTVLDILAFIQFAQSAGFTIPEIRQILTAFDGRVSTPRRWQALAKQKLHDVAAVIANAERMRAILKTLISCECVQLAECTQRCGPGNCVSRFQHLMRPQRLRLHSAADAGSGTSPQHRRIRDEARGSRRRSSASRPNQRIPTQGTAARLPA